MEQEKLAGFGMSLLKNLGKSTAKSTAERYTSKSLERAEKLIAAKFAPKSKSLFKGITKRPLNSDKNIELAKRLGIGTAIAGVGGSGLMMGKSHLIDPAVQSINIARSRSKILDANPSLKQEDPALVKSYFNVVKQFSPKAASNPLVAGALVNKMIQFGGVDHKLVQDLTSINKDVIGASSAGANIGRLSTSMGLLG